ncbi:MAG: hypothetical protein JXA11_01455 [Phycisphaerae bacterium]|nr:hypothetical protein [Phycisphaerae bacterium]
MSESDNHESSVNPSPREASSAASRRVESNAARDPAIRLGIAAVMLIGMGLWCFHDRNKYEPPAAWDMKHINEASKYAFNHFGAFVFVPPGAALVLWMLVFLRRKLIADQDGIGYAGKEKIPWGSITKLDTSQAKSKGILQLHYGDGKVLKLDNWKLTNFRELISLVESKIPSDKM